MVATLYFLCLVCKFSGCWLKTLQINKKYPSKFVLSNTSSSVLKVFCKLWTYTLGLREKSFVDILRLRPEREENKMEQLERLDPWEAVRMLGIRLPMSGSMEKELNFRTKQLNSLQIIENSVCMKYYMIN